MRGFTTMAAFDLLHALRVKGLASLAVLSGLSGIAEDELGTHVAPLIEEGLVVHREGRLGGYMLTPAGKVAAADALARDDSTIAARDELASFDERFLPVNTDFKKVCHRWQLVDDETPNDHSDAAYDEAVVADLGEVHRTVRGELDGLATTLPRFGRYGPRLDAALAKVRGGDVAAFARPMYDSYHDIWMELHNDVVLSIGRDRTAADESSH